MTFARYSTARLSPHGVAKVFVGVVDGGVGDADSHVVFLPIVAQLRQPLEIVLHKLSYVLRRWMADAWLRDELVVGGKSIHG